MVRGLIEAQEDEATEEGINYVAMRNLFVREALEVRVEKKTRTKHVRESAERLQVDRTVSSFQEFALTSSSAVSLPFSLGLLIDGGMVRVS